jgi:hypothetical protein
MGSLIFRCLPSGADTEVRPPATLELIPFGYGRLTDAHRDGDRGR